MAGAGDWSLLRAQKPFKEYAGFEYTNFEVPPDANVPHEWTRARLKYVQYGGGGRSFGFGGGNRWTMDYPRSDRHLLPGIKRLTRIDARSIEQVVELDGSDDVYNWPTLYAVEVGYWCMPDDQPAQLRDYLNRGGFLMVDDFHGNTEWDADAIRTGAASTTRRAASSWLFATTWIWGTPGSTPTTHGIPSR